MPSPWRVRIHYREPSFEARLGRQGAPFVWTYEVQAGDATTAIGAALRTFEEAAASSRVRWVRKVVDVVVAELPR